MHAVSSSLSVLGCGYSVDMRSLPSVPSRCDGALSQNKLSSLSVCAVICVCVGVWVALDVLDSLCRSGWPGTHSDPPASASPPKRRTKGVCHSARLQVFKK